MDDNSENFDELKRLLAVKRHEVPPPGFHRDLRERILNQIAEEDGAKAVGWWRRLVESFELRPALSSGFAAGLCGILVAGVYWGVQSGPEGSLQPSFVSDGQMGDPTREPEIHNPFSATNAVLTSPPPGVFDPQLGPGLQQVSKTNVSKPIR